MGHFIRSLSYVKDFIFIITDFSRVKCKKNPQKQQPASLPVEAGKEQFTMGELHTPQSYKGSRTCWWDSNSSKAQTA